MCAALGVGCCGEFWTVVEPEAVVHDRAGVVGEDTDIDEFDHPACRAA